MSNKTNTPSLRGHGYELTSKGVKAIADLGPQAAIIAKAIKGRSGLVAQQIIDATKKALAAPSPESTVRFYLSQFRTNGLAKFVTPRGAAKKAAKRTKKPATPATV
jgi:hypothetical protein